MFYRVDYQVALIVAGALAAVLLAGRMARLEGSRLARGYLVAAAALTAAGVVRFVSFYALGVHVMPQALGAAFGDVGTALLGFLIGLASVHSWRGGFAELLRAPEVLLAVCLSTGVTFVLAGIGKVFGMDFMLDFFAQSGYSKSFLLFIVTVEILGGMALVLPWRWLVLAAAFGLGVDMLGAIYTHVHNHDPLDDSTGAIALLLRLATIAILIVGRRRALGVAAATVVCAALAVVGSRLVRQPAFHVGSGELDYFVGTWRCAGTLASSGQSIEADLRFDSVLGGRWILVHTDDRPPHDDHALAEWSHRDDGWIATVQDSTGGLRMFRSSGWQQGRLVWEGTAVGANASARQRLVYQRLTDDKLEVAHETEESTGWQRVETVTCTRGPR